MEVRKYRRNEAHFLDQARHQLRAALGHTPPPRLHDGPTMEEAEKAQDEAEQKEKKKQAEVNKMWHWEHGGGQKNVALEASRGSNKKTLEHERSAGCSRVQQKGAGALLASCISAKPKKSRCTSNGPTR